MSNMKLWQEGGIYYQYMTSVADEQRIQEVLDSYSNDRTRRIHPIHLSDIVKIALKENVIPRTCFSFTIENGRYQLVQILTPEILDKMTILL